MMINRFVLLSILRNLFSHVLVNGESEGHQIIWRSRTRRGTRYPSICTSREESYSPVAVNINTMSNTLSRFHWHS
jgi:hypothetical protein